MTFNGAILAFCALYKLVTCSPDEVATTVMEHLGAPYDQITWCCGTYIEGGQTPTPWELQKPHTMLCDGRADGRDPAWSDGIGSIYMGHHFATEYKNYCAIWLHKGPPHVS